MNNCENCIDNRPRIGRLAGVTRTLRLAIYEGEGVPTGTPQDLTGNDVVVRVLRDGTEDIYLPGFVVEGDDHNVIKFEWPAAEQAVGNYTIDVTVTDGSGNVNRVNWHGPTGIRLVEFSYQEYGEDAVGQASSEGIGLVGYYTTNGVGMSAYDEWLAQGHTGTEADYIAWMQQPAREAASVAEAAMTVIQARADEDHATAGSDHTTATGDHAVHIEDHRIAGLNHLKAEDDHTRANTDHSRAESDHSRAEDDHSTAGADHTQAGSDHTRANTDHSRAESDHVSVVADHLQAAADHTKATQDSTRAGSDHDIAVADHAQAEADHTRAESDHTTAAADHTTAASDHTTAAADHTQAVADHAVMAGYDTRLTNIETDVTQLGQKWKEGPDVEITGFITGAYSTNGNYSTSVLAKAGAKGKNLDVTPGQKYRIYATSDASTWYRCCAVFKADGTKIYTASAGDFTVTPLEVTIPSDGAKMTINLINYNSATDGAFLITGDTDASTLQGEIDTLSTAADAAFLQDSRNTGVKMKADRYSAVNVDWMQVVSSGAVQNNNTIMTVVSATSDTLTLASEDAAQFVVHGPAVVHYPNGDVKVAYFQAASGTSVELWPTDDTDLTNADYVQNLHDTPRGGAGIHLSQLGYIMLAQFTAQQVAEKLSQKDSNLLASVQFYNSTIDGKTVKDVYGNAVATIDTDFAAGGQTPNGNGLTAYCAISESDSVNTETFGFLKTAFRFQQGIKDLYLSFNIPASGEGFIEIECSGFSARKEQTSTGTCTMEVYADDVMIYTTTLRKYFYRYQIPGVKVKSRIRVKYIIDGNVDTECAIYSINFWAMSSIVPAISLVGKKIAVLGDSWTQFPGVQNAISLYSDYNTLGTRPDGTALDGLAYFPKELARVTGATVDNWGKSNMRADNYGLEIIDTILAAKQYDYLVIEFFTNDVNASISAADWASNIALIAEKCKRACVRPLIMLPCRNNGATVHPLGVYHEVAMRGLGLM